MTPPVSPQDDPLCPFPAVVRSIEPEAPGVRTFRVEFADQERQARYRVEPGQFNMLYLPGIGEVPISVSGGPDEGSAIGHTIRFVGRVTRAMEALRPGSMIGIRGPYGSSWPLGQARGRDVVLVAGGLGMAPLRLAVKTLLAERAQYGRLVLLYGARQPADLLFSAEYDDWRRNGLELSVTVDQGRCLLARERGRGADLAPPVADRPRADGPARLRPGDHDAVLGCRGTRRRARRERDLRLARA